MSLNETQTRQQYIDSQLSKAGWGINGCVLIEEYYLRSNIETREDKSKYQAKGEFADYVLLGTNGKPIAVVEAKRTSRDALAGKRQAADYADTIQRQLGIEPFIFLTNGKEILFWDRPRYAPREISGFFTRDDLERLSYQKKYAKPLSEIKLNTDFRVSFSYNV